MSNYEMCDDNRFEIIKELKEYIIEATNIETSPKEMEVLDDICFRLWQLDLTLETKRKLKKLEKENKELKSELEISQKANKELSFTANAYAKAQKPYIEKIQKLEKVIEILLREKIKPSAFLGTLRNYKECYKIDMPYERACILLDCDITEEEFELLKEVLGE